MKQEFIKIFLISTLISLCATSFYIVFAKKARLVDRPNASRKIHKKPMPTTGGIVIWAAFLTAVLFSFNFEPVIMEPFTQRLAGIVLGSFLIVLLGFYDDMKSINPKVKLLGQVLAALALMAYGFIIEELSNPFGHGKLTLGILSVPVTLFWVVAITNAVNLSDGLDGLAGGISGIVSIFIFIAAVRENNLVVGFLALALAGSAIGFLPYNFYPARIFMGDTGSMFLGFTLSAIAIEGCQKSTAAVTLLVPVFALAVPIIDTGLSIVRRIIRKRKVFSADKEHIHHKFFSERRSQKKTVISLYLLTLYFGLIALSFQNLTGVFGVGAFIIVGLATLFWLKSARLLEFRK